MAEWCQHCDRYFTGLRFRQHLITLRGKGNKWKFINISYSCKELGILKKRKVGN